MFQSSPFVSYGALGRLVTVYGAHFSSPTRNIVHMNLNTPSTTMICGVQGAGKSHTVSVIIENSLISSPVLGSLPKSLSVVVFHLGAAQGGMHLPCESAFLNSGNRKYNIPVKVIVCVPTLARCEPVFAALNLPAKVKLPARNPIR